VSSSDASTFPAPMPRYIWLHGLVMLVLVIFVNLAQTALGICAVIQFFWMLIGKERNRHIANFGEGAAKWLAITARFLSGAADERPFPWTRWR
jgi:hypothetical protein